MCRQLDTSKLGCVVSSYTCGSRTSRNVSPRRARDTTVIVMNSPGNIVSQGPASRYCLAPSWSILPQDGSGGGMPSTSPAESKVLNRVQELKDQLKEKRNQLWQQIKNVLTVEQIQQVQNF